MRVPDELWDEMLRITAERGETITDVTIRAYERYVRTYGHAEELEDGSKQ